MTVQPKRALLGDTSSRDYSEKLELFNRFAEPEIRAMIAGLGVRRGECVLDAGCGAGLITFWLAEHVGEAGVAVGMDIAESHVRQAQHNTQASALPVRFVQGDMAHPPFLAETFDWIWCSNTINHLRQPVEEIRTLTRLLRPGGRVALGQSAFLPDMFFAWDFRLEKEVMLACRQYYRDKYGLQERDTTASRNLYGLLRQAGLHRVTVQTHVIERVTPLRPHDERYFLECVFRGYWGHRVRPYLTDEDWRDLCRLCDPESPDYCLRRPDFHHVQTFTVVIGQKAI